MRIRRYIYTLIILLCTFISVSLIIYDKKELSKNNHIYFKGLHTIKIPEELKDDKVEENESEQVDEKVEVEDINKEVKKDKKDRDEETQKLLLRELNEGIKRAKLNQFEERLSDDRVKEIDIGEVKSSLNKKDKEKSGKIIDKLGPMTSIRLMKILDDGIRPDEQKEIYDLFKDKLSEEEIISLNDILGSFAD